MPIAFWSVVAALFGLAVGSFLNVVIYRVPLGMSISRPRSQCTACGSAIRWQHNIPVLGWLVLRGRCYDCAARISARYPAIEALSGLTFGVATFAVLSAR